MSLAWAGRCSSLLKRAECAGFSLFKRSIYCANDSILHRSSARSRVCTLKTASTLSMPPKRKTAKGQAKAEGETEAKQTRTSPRKAKAAVEKETKKTKEEKNEDPPAAEKAEEAPAAAEEKAKKPKPKKAGSVREAIPDVNKLDFTSDAKTPDGKKWNMKFSSWNINGIRAWVEKNGHSYIKKEDPDIFCVQETKCNKDQIPESVEVDGYHVYWLSGDKDGYSGTGLYSKKKPIEVKYGLGIDEHDKEGRVITAEYDNFFFVTAYVPNSGRGLPRLPYREKKWDPDFREYLKTLDKKKPVILCGDLNVAHEEIDLANPKGNKKGPGFTQQERDGFTALLEEGFVDSFRHLYPEETGAYSYWTYMGNARAKNVGWRLDYFVISERLKPSLCDNVIRTGVMGSDHCPITLFMHME